MKSLYVALISVAAAVGVTVLVFRNREFLKTKLTPSADKAKDMANRTWGGVRSTAGRVAKSASDMIHTERPDPNTPSQA